MQRPRFLRSVLNRVVERLGRVKYGSGLRRAAARIRNKSSLPVHCPFDFPTYQCLIQGQNEIMIQSRICRDNRIHEGFFSSRQCDLLRQMYASNFGG